MNTGLIIGIDMRYQNTWPFVIRNITIVLKAFKHLSSRCSGFVSAINRYQLRLTEKADRIVSAAEISTITFTLSVMQRR